MKYSIGLDIGGTKIAAGILNEKGDMIQREQVPSIVSDREAMFSQVVKCVDTLLNHCSIPKEQISGIGAGVPGKIDHKKGIAVFQNNLPWAQFPIAERLRNHFGIENVIIDNDVYMAAYAEYQRAHMQEDELFVYLTISTGISCSILENDRFIRGAGFAGEVGLLPVTTPYAEKKVERLEPTVSGPAMERFGRFLSKNNHLTTKDVFTAYQNNESYAVELVEHSLTSLAHGIYALVSIIDPHAIVLGGSVATRNPYLLPLLEEKVAEFLIDEQRHILEGISISEMGSDQGIIGAGLRVF